MLFTLSHFGISIIEIYLTLRNTLNSSEKLSQAPNNLSLFSLPSCHIVQQRFLFHCVVMPRICHSRKKDLERPRLIMVHFLALFASIFI